jgi:hypothetical protein
MANPQNRMARMNALKMIMGKTTNDINSMGPLAALKAKVEKTASIPLSTEAGLKESQTKKLRRFI